MNRYARTPPLTTSHAVVAWVLTRKSTDECSLFRVRSLPEPTPLEGSRPAPHAPRIVSTTRSGAQRLEEVAARLVAERDEAVAELTAAVWDWSANCSRRC